MGGFACLFVQSLPVARLRHYLLILEILILTRRGEHLDSFACEQATCTGVLADVVRRGNYSPAELFLFSIFSDVCPASPIGELRMKFP